MDFLPASLAALLRSFTDASRLLALHIDAGEPDGSLLLAGRLHGREALSECYAYELECYSAKAGIGPERFLGRRIGVELKGVTGNARWFNGVVTRATPRGADGGFARFDLTLAPHLALLGIGRVARTYQELSVPDILDAELRRWQPSVPDLQWRFALIGRYPVRSYTVFHQESALAAIERLAAEEGIGYYFEHLPADGDEVGLQSLVFFDDVGALPSNAQAVQPYRQALATEAFDTIDRWEPTRRLVPGGVALQSWEYKGVASLTADLPTLIDDGPGADLARGLPDYGPQSQYYGSGSDDLYRYARLRMEAFESGALCWDGGGSIRSAVAGSSFHLDGHYAAADDKGFLYVAVEHDARNNLAPELLHRISGLVGGGTEEAVGEAGYRNRFTAVRAGVPWRPAYEQSRHAKPTAPGVQPALVVGPPGEEVHTDALGRIQVRFPWDPEGRDTCWLRVLTPVAGEGWGQLHLPRVGQEVLVGYIGNDIDRPVVLGCLSNGTHPPPRFSGAGRYPANRALSGFQSRELRGSGYGELLFDDSTGQIKTKLSSEYGKTQLNLGWIGGPRYDGASVYRGAGFELRSDLFGALRAAKGLLISADPRPEGKGGTLDRQELLGQLDVTLAMSRQLGEMATAHQAGGTDTSGQAALRDAVGGWGDHKQPAEAAIAVSAPAGIALSSPRSVQAASGSNLDFTAMQDANLSTGRKIVMRAAQGIAAFAHQAGMKLVAAAGQLQLMAHRDGIDIGAAKRLHQYSLDSILIEAPRILLKTAGAQIALDESGITLSATGQVQGKAAGFNFGGGGGGGIDLPGMPTSSMRTNERVAFAGRAGQAREGITYTVHDADGALRDDGSSAADGASGSIVSDTDMKPLSITPKP
jgi:type VI secretion system secreted protein VgrG